MTFINGLQATRFKSRARPILLINLLVEMTLNFIAIQPIRNGVNMNMSLFQCATCVICFQIIHLFNYMACTSVTFVPVDMINLYTSARY